MWRHVKILILVLLIADHSGKISAQVYGPYIYGDYGAVFMTGSNLFNNALQVSPNNSISDIFLTAPEGTTVSLWNPATLSFCLTSVFTNGSWSTNLSLPPGTGGLVITPSPFTNSVNGYVLNHDGSPLTNDSLTIPPAFSGPNGIYLLGDKTIVNDVGTNIFLNIIGRMPFVGEQVITLSGTNTYLGNGSWDSVPTLNIGQAAFLNIISVPAPQLSIARTNQQIIVSWPSSLNVWTLQTNSDLTTTNWGNYSGSVANNSITNSPTTEPVFFRLFYP